MQRDIHQIDTLPADLGPRMMGLIAGLYPICRSITGEGLRRSLAMVAERIPITFHEVPTGTPVLDWTIPKEWNVRDAYIIAPDGRKLAEFGKHNLQLVNYSCPIDTEMSLAELKPHLHSLPSHPDWIPYRTSYYKEEWGFCLCHRELEQLAEGTYRVRIDSTLADGHLTYGELMLPGAARDEVLLSCHICHPSLANDNLSGVALCTYLAQLIQSVEHRYTYRFIFAPGTIGAITWLARNRDIVEHVKHGLVVACVGDSGFMHYKRSRHGNAEIDRAVEQMLKHSGKKYEIRDFSPYGYDERQYCSPGFDLPVGSLTRTPSGEYPEYHTSADNLDLIKAESLVDSFGTYLSVLRILESNKTFTNLQPYGEPQLGRRGLYRSLGGSAGTKADEMAMLWVLNQSDGSRSLLDIAERSNLPYETINKAAILLREHDLLSEKG